MCVCLQPTFHWRFFELVIVAECAVSRVVNFCGVRANVFVFFNALRYMGIHFYSENTKQLVRGDWHDIKWSAGREREWAFLLAKFRQGQDC